MKKPLSTLLATAMLLSTASCATQELSSPESSSSLAEIELPYQARLFDRAENLLTENFLTENGTHYPFINDGLPDSRCQIVDTEEKFTNVFPSFPVEVDFSQNILIVYLFTDIYYGFDCTLNEITEIEDVLTVVIEHGMAEPDETGAVPPSTSQPIQRCLIIQLSNCPTKVVNVDLIYP